MPSVRARCISVAQSKQKKRGRGRGSCGLLCSNGGRYCVPDPGFPDGSAVTGMDVVEESLRQKCVWLAHGGATGNSSDEVCVLSIGWISCSRDPPACYIYHTANLYIYILSIEPRTFVKRRVLNSGLSGLRAVALEKHVLLEASVE